LSLVIFHLSFSILFGRVAAQFHAGEMACLHLEVASQMENDKWKMTND
jgi:hypothetical protein